LTFNLSYCVHRLQIEALEAESHAREKQRVADATQAKTAVAQAREGTVTEAAEPKRAKRAQQARQGAPAPVPPPLDRNPFSVSATKKRGPMQALANFASSITVVHVAGVFIVAMWVKLGLQARTSLEPVLENEKGWEPGSSSKPKRCKSPKKGRKSA